MAGLTQWYDNWHDNYSKKNRDCGGFFNRFLTAEDVIAHYVCNYYMLRNYQRKNLEINHAGILIALVDDCQEDILGYCSGFDLLIKYLDVKKELFDIYICNTKEAAKEVIERPEVNKIWIFGHGWMGGLYLGKTDKLDYSEFKNLPEEQKKDFIGQFHCNTDGDLNSSLAAYALKPDGKKFIKKGYRCSHQNRLAIECCNRKDWDCVDSCEKQNNSI